MRDRLARVTVTIRTIAILLHDFNAGGTEATALRLAEEWLRAGRRVVIVAGAADGAMRDRVPDGAIVRILKPPVPRSRFSRLRLGAAMAPVVGDAGANVVYVPGNFHFPLARGIRRSLPEVPIVAKISNPLLPDLSRPLAAPARAVLRAMTLGIDMFVAMSPALAARDAPLLPGRPIRVAPEPNLPRDHRPCPRPAAAPAPPTILAIGRMEPQKNLSLAIRAFSALRRRQPARLTILGDGSERGVLEALARTLGVADDVTMPGFVSDVPERLASASLLLVTSRYEGFPAVTVEALAADVPVISTDCSPAQHALLATPTHGIVVDRATPEALADAMTHVLAMPFRSDVRATSVAAYAAPASAARYLSIFEESSERTSATY
jgi:glycosyltransferase involved in cell wall biosynthesis